MAEILNCTNNIHKLNIIFWRSNLGGLIAPLVLCVQYMSDGKRGIHKK